LSYASLRVDGLPGSLPRAHKSPQPLDEYSIVLAGFQSGCRILQHMLMARSAGTTQILQSAVGIRR